MDELDNRHSGFWRLLLRWIWTVKTPLKMLATDAKNLTRSEFFYDGRKFRRQCANVIDITWGRIYFSMCEHFGRKIRTQCAMALRGKKRPVTTSLCLSRLWPYSDKRKWVTAFTWPYAFWLIKHNRLKNVNALIEKVSKLMRNLHIGQDYYH